MGAARDGMTVADLMRHFALYPVDLPVEFTSCESGGFWPKGKTAMAVFTDEQIAAVSNGAPADNPGHLQIMLMAKD